MPHRRAVAPAPAIALAAVLLLAAGCSGGARGGHAAGRTRLTLVAYSTPQDAFQQLIPAFQRTAAGRDVVFTQSYGASGDQSRAVAGGLKADVVEFSLAPDMTRLVKAKLVAPGWDAGPDHGMVTDSVVVLVVRKGNPKGIHTWADLLEPGVDVLTPNPFTSGGARWDVMAAYGAQLQQGRTRAQAVDYLTQLFHHVSVQDKSAREALQTFSQGKGDVMIAYESEAITAQRRHLDVDYVVPQQTILIENPVAVVATSRHAAAAGAFVDFLRSAQGQRIFAQAGYRPVLEGAGAGVAAFPTPAQLFTIAGLGGWAKVSDEFFDPHKGLMATVEREVGGSVGKS